MRDHQPTGMQMTAANGNWTYAATASTDLQPLPMDSPISVDSQFSLLTTASSSGSPTQQCDWPEFQSSYNEIMDNTNLLDSCAAALNDISIENGQMLKAGQTEKLRHDFNRSLSSSTTTTTTTTIFSGSENIEVTMKCIDHYVRWLCEMEIRVASQPKLSKIIAMNSKQKAIQLNIHSNMFKEIVQRPCIFKNPNRNDDEKSIEERYHVLYLKVYEVLLLIDGIPTNSFKSSKRILSETHLADSYESGQNMHENQSPSSSSTSLSSLSDDDADGIHDHNVTTPAYNETNILSTSIGTYYFKYDDTNEQQTDNNKCSEKLSSTALGCSDKEFSFEHDLHSLLNTSDSFGQRSHENTFAMCNMQQHSTAVELDSIDSGGCGNSLAHHKVYDWLNTNTDISRSKSSVNLDCSTNSEADYQLIYRAKSEQHLNLLAKRPMDAKYLSPSLYTSLNFLPVNNPMKNSESKLNESITEESSLIWDNFQMGNNSLKVDSDVGLMGNDSDTKDLSNQICYFGDDYWLHFTETNIAECELSSDIEAQKKIANENCEKDVKILSTPSHPTQPQQKQSTEVKRGRRYRKRRSTRNSMSSSDQSSKSRSSAATTASIDSVKNNEMMQTNQSTDEFTPETTISYNSSEMQFELHTKESDAPKKMKINEMRPEHFHDIVKMCQSNIDCVITVLGAAPNRTLTVAYCQQMKFERYHKSDAETICKCKHEHNSMVNNPRTKDTECKCCTVSQADSEAMCVCAWVSHTIAMILNFLMDCWNVFRNMKLYTYLCRVTKALFGSTRYVADHLRSTQALANAKVIKYS